MNTVYLVVPLVLLGAFAGYVVPAGAKHDAVLAARAVVEKQRHAAEQREREKQREVAAADQRDRAEARRRDQADREQAKRDAQEQCDQALSETLARACAERNQLRAEITTLEIKLCDLVHARDRADVALHEARVALEQHLVSRRNADLELQRMTLLLAETVDANDFNGAPLFPAPGAR